MSDFYIGPFAECITETVNTEEKYNGCNDEQCPYYLNQTHHKFCPGCGKLNEQCSRITNLDKVNAAEIQEKIDEALARIDHAKSAGQRQFWIPNKHKKPEIGYHFDDGTQEFIIKLDNEAFKVLSTYINKIEEIYAFANIETGIELFKSQYAHALNVLQEYYGKDKVEVRWGLCSWSY